MKVSEKDFEYMCECMERDVILLLVEEHGMTLHQAFDAFYNSQIFEKLHLPGTGLFFQSPRYVLSFLLDELNGKTNIVAS